MKKTRKACRPWERTYACGETVAYLLCYTSFTFSPCSFVTDAAVNLILVLTVVAVAFLLLGLHIAGVVAISVLLRRAKRRITLTSLEKKVTLVDRIECIEKREDSLQKLDEFQGKAEESAAGSDSDHCIGDDRVEQHVEELHDQSANVLRQGYLNRAEDSRIRYKGNCDEIDAAEVLCKDGDGHSAAENSQQGDQPADKPDAVYAVVDKSKKRKKRETEVDQSTTDLQGAYTEEFHYDCGNVLGQDWLGNVEKPEGDTGRVEKGSPSDKTKGTGPQSEPCNQHAVYAVIDKSKKRSKAK